MTPVTKMISLCLLPALALLCASAAQPHEEHDRPKNLGDFCQKLPKPTEFWSLTSFGDLISKAGKTYRLADLHIHRLADSGHYPKQVLSWLNIQVKKRELIIIETGVEDRHGRHLAHLARPDGSWLQAEMIAAGHAYFMPSRSRKAKIARAKCDDRALKNALKTQANARFLENPLTKKTLNLVDSGQRFDAKDKILWKMAGKFVIVEGPVVAVATLKRGTAINFGKDWKTDFTAFLKKDLAVRLKKEGTDLSKLVGQKIRLRGYLDLYNGPNMPINHLSQMELLEK